MTASSSTAMTLRCLECEEYARWHIWYKGLSSSFPVGYNSFCDEHVINEVKNGREGYQVECIKLVADQFLPDDDRAKNNLTD